ncbi:MAG TPA: hypothetical protein VK589_28405 [Chryseolinea sp.]|nr:hypothetical protein [Chryseolinea sp.]
MLAQLTLGTALRTVMAIGLFALTLDAKAQEVVNYRALTTYIRDVWAPEHAKRIKKVQKYTFVIVFNNDSSIVTQTNVELILGRFIMMVGSGKDMTVVKAEHTKNVYRRLDTGKHIPGIPIDKAWIFKINEGPIFVYSFFSDAELKYENIAAIQKNDGPIVVLSRDNLLTMIEPGSDAYPLAENSELEKAIRKYNRQNSK